MGIIKKNYKSAKLAPMIKYVNAKMAPYILTKECQNDITKAR